MPRIKSFETAAARRRRDPIVLEIDGTEIRCLASVDLAEIAHAQELMGEESPEDMSASERVRFQRRNLLAAIKVMIEPDDHTLLDAMESDLDFRMIGEMIRELFAEYAGAGNPTKPAESSAGSPETGSSSTDGAQPEA